MWNVEGQSVSVIDVYPAVIMIAFNCFKTLLV